MKTEQLGNLGVQAGNIPPGGLLVILLEFLARTTGGQKEAQAHRTELEAALDRFAETCNGARTIGRPEKIRRAAGALSLVQQVVQRAMERLEVVVPAQNRILVQADIDTGGESEQPVGQPAVGSTEWFAREQQEMESDLLAMEQKGRVQSATRDGGGHVLNGVTKGSLISEETRLSRLAEEIEAVVGPPSSWVMTPPSSSFSAR